MATYDHDDERWQDEELVEFVARHIVSVAPSELLPWRDALRPAKVHISGPLIAIFRDGNSDVQVLGIATDILTDYLSDDAERLFDLMADSKQKQFPRIFAKLTARPQQAVELGNAEVVKILAADANDDEKEALAKRQANAAAMLLKMNAAEQVWPLLKHSPDNRLRSYLIHKLRPLHVEASVLVRRLDDESDVTVQRALLLALGEYDEQDLEEAERSELLSRVQETYTTATDPGLHAASEWLLRTWKRGT